MSSPESELLTIGDLARQTGRRASSIRYYESIGVLPEPIRVGGRRRYRADAIRTLTVVDTAQRAGLALDEIRTLLEAAAGGASAVDHLRRIAERKLPEVDALIERTELVRSWLECATRCECPSLDECDLFASPDPLPPVHPAARRVRA